MKIRAFLIVALAFPLLAQQAANAPAQSAASPAKTLPPEAVAEANEIIHRQFGEGFSLATDLASPIVKADFDGDGIEDIAFVATAKKTPQMISDAGYRMIDPYHEFFGYGNPRTTLHFSAGDVQPPKYLLILHGNGAEGWHADLPKSKFVVINLPFDQLDVTRIIWKKKRITAIEMQESTIMYSLLFWDGKKYRWEPSDLMD